MAGLEQVLAREIEGIGGTHIEPGNRVVHFAGEQKTLYRANLELRTALRILKPIEEFTAHNEEQLYRYIWNMDWFQYLKATDTFAIDAVGLSTVFRHTKYLALKTKDAIVDQFRERAGRRPSVNVLNPKLRLHLHVQEKTFTLSLDSSGDSLHKRGYRINAVEAPINEVLAAGMVLLSDWKRDGAFIDPFCGSGTLVIEAALFAHQMPANRTRTEFGFMKWPDFDAALWETVKKEADARIVPFEHPILGYDKNFKAIRVSETNAEAAGLYGKVSFSKTPFEKLTPPVERGILITNPPYDERLGSDDIGALYRTIGDRLKQHFSGFDAWIISSNLEALKQVGLRASRRIALFNGPLECKFQKYELYEGSKKEKNETV